MIDLEEFKVRKRKTEKKLYPLMFFYLIIFYGTIILSLHFMEKYQNSLFALLIIIILTLLLWFLIFISSKKYNISFYKNNNLTCPNCNEMFSVDIAEITGLCSNCYAELVYVDVELIELRENKPLLFIQYRSYKMIMKFILLFLPYLVIALLFVMSIFYESASIGFILGLSVIIVLGFMLLLKYQIKKYQAYCPNCKSSDLKFSNGFLLWSKFYVKTGQCPKCGVVSCTNISNN